MTCFQYVMEIRITQTISRQHHKLVRNMLQSGRTMDTRSILLAVKDPQTLIDITQALGPGWRVASVASEADALLLFEKRSFDALLVDFNLVSPDASELLNQVLEKYPNTIRFLLAYEADLALVAAKVLGTPHILPKPVDPISLKSRIENEVKDSNAEPRESEPANIPVDVPAIPSIYAEVLKTLELPGVTNEQAGEIIARDAALTSELLKLTNSSYLGMPRNISDPVKAVAALGLETVRVAVMTLQFLAEHSRLRFGYLSVDQIWQHSVNVGQIARDLVLFETKDRALASQALAAGLLHDLGKVVLAKNFEDLYGRVHSLARKQPVAMWDIEKEMFGANHGEIGACLVGMWNMPAAIVDAAALHHEPALGQHEELTPLVAVHVANVLEHELRPGNEEMIVTPIIHTPFLNQVGLLQRLPVWRAAFANRRAENPEAETESAETNQSEASAPARTGSRANQPLGPLAPAQPRNGKGTSPVYGARDRSHWVFAGAFVLLLPILWFTFRPDSDQPDTAYARPSAPRETPAAVSPILSSEMASAQITPTTISEEPSGFEEPPLWDLPPAPATAASPAQTVQPKASPPSATTPPASTTPPAVAHMPTVATAPASAVPVATIPAAVTNVPSPGAAPQPTQPEFRLNGIIYTTRPSAIVNGQMVKIGDQVDGATIVAIGRTTVTLQVNGQRKTCALR